jgi:hypothetical protein
MNASTPIASALRTRRQALSSLRRIASADRPNPVHAERAHVKLDSANASIVELSEKDGVVAEIVSRAGLRLN